MQEVARCCAHLQTRSETLAAKLCPGTNARLLPRGRLSIQTTELQVFLAKVSANGLGWRAFLNSFHSKLLKISIVTWSIAQPAAIVAVAAIAAIGMQDGFVGEEEFRKTMVPAVALEDWPLQLLQMFMMREPDWQVENLAVSVGVQPPLLA